MEINVGMDSICEAHQTVVVQELYAIWTPLNGTTSNNILTALAALSELHYIITNYL